uniref:Uncharacterized protein n=1 Tax=Anguilla anguilla TaxID=7936 RepID=A0A0E9X7E3_ANGAN
MSDYVTSYQIFAVGLKVNLGVYFILETTKKKSKSRRNVYMVTIKLGLSLALKGKCFKLQVSNEMPNRLNSE